MFSPQFITKVEKYFPEIDISLFVERYIVPKKDFSNITVNECQAINKKMINILQELSSLLSSEKVELNDCKSKIDKVRRNILYTISSGIEYVYKDISNFSKETNKSWTTSDDKKKAFADHILDLMEEDGLIESISTKENRVTLLLDMWFAMRDLANRVDAYSDNQKSVLYRIRTKGGTINE